MVSILQSLIEHLIEGWLKQCISSNCAGGVLWIIIFDGKV